jgi:hypothetical protein
MSVSSTPLLRVTPLSGSTLAIAILRDRRRLSAALAFKANTALSNGKTDIPFLG